MSQKYQAPQGCPGVSIMGEFYEADASGIVTIPDGIVSDIASHGFTPASDAPASVTPAPSILDGKAADIVAAIPSLDDSALNQLLADEQAGKARKTVIEAIMAEQSARASAGAGA